MTEVTPLRGVGRRDHPRPRHGPSLRLKEATDMGDIHEPSAAVASLLGRDAPAHEPLLFVEEAAS
jgi:hypothetical protein